MDVAEKGTVAIGKTRVPVQQLFSHSGGFFDESLRRLNVQMCILAFSSVALMVIYNQVCWNGHTLDFYDDEECMTSFVFKIINWGLSLVFIQRLVVYYQVKSYKKQSVFFFPTRWDAFMQSSLKFKFVAELFLSLIQPIPYVGDYAFDHTMVVMCVFVRLYLVGRLFQDFTYLYRKRHHIVKTVKNYDPTFTNRIRFFTVFKIYFYTDTLMFVCMLFLFCIIPLAYIVYIMERGFWTPLDKFSGLKPMSAVEIRRAGLDFSLFDRSDFSNLANCFWYMAVTMTTLGYGDLAPFTERGRFFAIIGCLSGIVLTSLLVGVISNKLTPRPFDQYLIDWLSNDEQRIQKAHLAATIIQVAWRQTRAMRAMRLSRMNQLTSPIGDAEVVAVTVQPHAQPQRRGRQLPPTTPLLSSGVGSSASVVGSGTGPGSHQRRSSASGPNLNIERYEAKSFSFADVNLASPLWRPSLSVDDVGTGAGATPADRRADKARRAAHLMRAIRPWVKKMKKLYVHQIEGEMLDSQTEKIIVANEQFQSKVLEALHGVERALGVIRPVEPQRVSAVDSEPGLISSRPQNRIDADESLLRDRSVAESIGLPVAALLSPNSARKRARPSGRTNTANAQNTASSAMAINQRADTDADAGGGVGDGVGSLVGSLMSVGSVSEAYLASTSESLLGTVGGAESEHGTGSGGIGSDAHLERRLKGLVDARVRAGLEVMTERLAAQQEKLAQRLTETVLLALQQSQQNTSTAAAAGAT